MRLDYRHAPQVNGYCTCGRLWPHDFVPSWGGCDRENGCSDEAKAGPCTCPPHDEDSEVQCGEDEAALCHYCAHLDCEAPCPAAGGAS